MGSRGMNALAYFMERASGLLLPDDTGSLEMYAEHLVESVREEMREEIGDDIAFVAKASEQGRAHRPKFERGGFLNDCEWMERVAREGRPEGIED